MKRRAFLTGIASALAAPAIVKAENLMKIYVPRRRLSWDGYAFGVGSPLFADKTATEVLNQVLLEKYLTEWGSVAIVPQRLIVPRGPYRDLLKGLTA